MSVEPSYNLADPGRDSTSLEGRNPKISRNLSKEKRINAGGIRERQKSTVMNKNSRIIVLLIFPSDVRSPWSPRRA